MSYKYLDHAYSPDTTELANRFPQWHPIRTKRQTSTGHKFLNATAGLGFETLSDLRLESIDNAFLGTARTNQIASLWGITPPNRTLRDENTSRNLLKNSSFELTPRSDGIAIYWSTTGTVEAQTDTVFYGGRALKVTVDAGQEAYVLQSVENNFHANRQLGISVWYQGANTLTGSDGLHVYLTGNKVEDGSTIPTSQALALASTDGRFMRLAASVTFSHDVTNVYFVMRVRNTSSSQIIYYIDAPQLEIGGEVTPYTIKYEDAPWFVDSENVGPFDLFFSSGTKRRVFYCNTFEDFAYRSVPTRTSVIALSKGYTLQTPNTRYKYKIEFDRKLWQTQLQISGSQIKRINADLPAETFATYDLYEMADIGTFSVNPGQTLVDLGIFDELLYIITKESDKYYIKICNPEMAEPESDKLYVIQTIELGDPYEFLSSTVTAVTMYQVIGRSDLFALDVTYEDVSTIRYGVQLYHDYYIYDEDAQQILARENYNLDGGLIVV